MYSLRPFTILFYIICSHKFEPIRGELFWEQLGEDIDGEAKDDEFGYSVAMSGDGARIAIGAPYNDGNGFQSGHVRVYQFQDSWEKLGEDIDGEALYDLSGWSVAMSGDGSRITVGAPGNTNSNGCFSGHMRVYQFQDSSWEKMGEDINGEADDDYAGRAVAMSRDGTRVAIGARYNDGNGDHSGSVQVYQFEDSSWEKMGEDIDGEAPKDYSGYSVAMSGNGVRIAIGANENDDFDYYAGHVRVYQFQDDSWEIMGDDIDGEAKDDGSGFSVTMSDDGSRIAIGAIYNEGNGAASGHVRVYQFQDSWEKLGDDIDGEAVYDRSGSSVAMSKDGARIAIGAIYNGGNGYASGHVRVYQFQDSWEQLGQDIDGEASYDKSGFSVAMSDDGTRIAIGARNNASNGIDSGHIRVFQLSSISRCGSYSYLQSKLCRGRANEGDKFPIFWTVSMDKDKLKNTECKKNACKRPECCLWGPERTCANTGKKGPVCGGFTKQMCGSGNKLKGMKKRAITPCTGKNGARCTVKNCCVTQNST